jgi:hypothetical protein
MDMIKTTETHTEFWSQRTLESRRSILNQRRRKEPSREFRLKAETTD